MSRSGKYEGPDMTQTEGREGLRYRQQRGILAIEHRLKFDGLGGDGFLADPKDWEAYDRSKSDPYDEGHGC